MNVFFGTVRPGIALGAGEADRLRGEIDAVLTGMNALNVGNHCTIPNFKLDDGRRIPITAQISNINGRDMTVNLS